MLHLPQCDYERGHDHVRKGDGKEELPAELHDLVVAEPRESGPLPDEEEDQHAYLNEEP